MSAEPDSNPQPDRGRSTWVITAAVVLIGTLAVFSYSLTEEDDAASGAALYDSAVKEALRGLVNPGLRGRPAAGARPALPAGLSPDEHYWCEKCKAWHKKQGAAGPQAPASAPPTPRVVVPYALGRAPGDAQPAAGTIPPLPEGLSPDGYYWCENCKAYHKKDAEGAPAHGAAATPPPRRVVVPYRLGMSPGEHPPATRPPPLPSHLSPEDYYWCGKCRAYHKRAGAPPKSHSQ